MVARLSLLGWVWLALIALTAANWLLMEVGLVDWRAGHKWFGGLIIILALIKVRLVIRHFMEVREAPRALGLIFDCWLAAVCGSLLVQLLAFGG